MIILFIFIFIFLLACLLIWRLLGYGFSFFGLLSLLCLVLGLSLGLYIYGGSYGGGVISDISSGRLIDLRERVVEEPGDLSGWLGLLEFYVVVGDFRGGLLVLDGALVYHGGNEDLLVLREHFLRLAERN